MRIRHVFLLVILLTTAPLAVGLAWLAAREHLGPNLLSTSLGLGAMLLALGLALSMLLARFFARPLEQMQAAAARLAQDRSGEQLSLRGPREVRQLGESINAMSLSLHQQWQDLAQSREELIFTLQSLGDAIITIDTAGHITQLNPSAERLTGWRRQDALWKPSHQVVKLFGPPPLLQPRDNLVSDILQQGETNTTAQPGLLISREGSRYHVSIKAAPLRGTGGLTAGVVLAIRDVTEQYRQQAALIESEAKFAQIFNLNPDAVVVLRMRDGTLVDCNEGFCRLTGFTREEALGRAPSSPELNLWTDLSERDRIIAQVKEKGEVVDFEAHGRRKNGTPMDVLVSVRQLTVGGEPCMLSVVRDVTPAKQREKELREHAARLQVLFDESPIGIWEEDFSEVQRRFDLWRLQGVTDWAAFFRQHPEEVAYCASLVKILDLNLTGVRFLGVADKAHVVRNLQAYFRDESMPVFRAELIALAGGATRFESELPSLDAQGTHRTLYLNLVVVPSHRETLGRVLVSFADITDRKRAEQEVRDNAARLDVALHSAHLGVWEFDLVANRRRFDDYTCQILGIDPATFGGTPEEFYQVVHVDDREMLRTALRRAIDHQEAYAPEYRAVRRDGTWRYIKAMGRLIRADDGQPRKFCGVVWDCTEQRQAELHLRQVQKMEAVGQLAGGVAHDFNNIITATMMNLQLLQQEASLTPSMRATLEELFTESKRATALARQLLVFSRQESAQARPIELNETLAHFFKMIRRLLAENIRLVFRERDQALWIEADSGMMEQVVMNLCLNARDAMPRGGELTVSTKRIHYTAANLPRHPDARPGEFVCLEVSDTGCGINAAVLPRIFEPYFTTKEAGKGTGLGLSIVYGIVRQHEGWIQVESTEGHGTAFHLFFPALPAEAAARAETEASAPAPTVGGSETILLVEDESLVRRASAQYLRSIGYHVLTAVDGREAIEIWSAGNADQIQLVITDLVMPNDITGVDLCERFQEENPRLKVIITSGYRADLAPENVLSRPGVTFLAKPCSAATLARTVREHLDGAS